MRDGEKAIKPELAVEWKKFSFETGTYRTYRKQ